jgi:hypothetical protein
VVIPQLVRNIAVADMVLLFLLLPGFEAPRMAHWCLADGYLCVFNNCFRKSMGTKLSVEGGVLRLGQEGAMM